MAAANPYQLDPLLAQGFSNLTKALVGDPQSDVYGAKADLLRQQIEQSKASGRASDSLASLRAEQRRLEALKTARFGDLQKVASEPNALLANAMLTTLGEQGAEMDALGNVVKIQPEGAPLQSVPYKIDPTTGTGTDLGVNNLTNAMFGNLDFTPNQFASALTELGEGRQSSLARAILLDPNASIEAKAGAFQSMGNSPGKYFDPSFANSELVKTLAAGTDQSTATDASRLEGVQYTADTVEAAANREDDLRFGKGGQGDRDSNDKLTWEQYKADRGLDAKKYESNKVSGDRRYNSDQVFELGKYKHDNRTIEIEVGNDKVITLDPASGAKLGLQKNSDGLYQIEGPKTTNVVTVKIGQADVIMDKETAEALNVPINDDGQYVIKGAGYASSSGAGNSKLGFTASEFSTQYTKVIENVPDYDGIPSNVRALLKTQLNNWTTSALQDGSALDKSTAFQTMVTSVLGQGVESFGYLNPTVPNFGVPKFFMDQWRDNRPATEVADAAKAMGYNDEQIEAIIDRIREEKNAG